MHHRLAPKGGARNEYREIMLELYDETDEDASPEAGPSVSER
jgi:hypothetical protein